MEHITISTDGVSRGNPGSAAIAVRITDAGGAVIEEVVEKIGNATNTFAEYQAVLRGLQIAQEHFGKKTLELQVEIKLSSDFVVKQLRGESEIHEPGLVPHFIAIHNLRVSAFPQTTFTYSRRELNKKVSLLMNEALGT